MNGIELAKESKTPTERDFEETKGVLAWIAVYDPQGRQSIRFGYTITASKGTRIAGF